ncbi:hypothetical protein [Natrinema salaciae]|uniref:MYXO-CTERM domain-containing protein n=1 Tax=Natrinema salaciae TaxID=1186196 RepID=A0A1H9CFE6_9EURY|nr:hypothetical protein [Natrinema salaciae]SEP99378.1 hypothetical protein SAMN04489841_1026 [Natrinema salaciae]
MPEMEQQDKTLSELIVKEAVNRGMESPMRDSILEAVEEADGSRSGSRLPLAGALFGLGTAVGFLVGRQSPELEESPIEELEEPEIIEDVMESADEMSETTAETGESATSGGESGSGSRLPRLLLVIGAVAGAVALRRRLSAGEEEEWEPIEEFEPATGGETEAEESEMDEDAEDAEAGAADDEVEE